VILCGGATKPNDFFTKTEGRNLQGIHFAMEFLHANTKSLLDSSHQDGRFISAKDKDVIVIGGGDTGTDCVGTALRHGCKSLVQLEIVPYAAGTRRRQPLAAMAQGLSSDYGQEEGKALWGEDPRQYLFRPPSLWAMRLAGCKRFTRFWSNGSKTTAELSREYTRLGKSAARSARLARARFLRPENQLLDQLGVDKDPRSNAKAEHGKFATSVPGVFAAGDMRRGQSLVVWPSTKARRRPRMRSIFDGRYVAAVREPGAFGSEPER